VEELTFPEAVDKLWSDGFGNDINFKPQLDHCGLCNPSIQYDYVGRIEDVLEDTRLIYEHAGMSKVSVRTALGIIYT